VSFEGSSAILVHEETGLIVSNGNIDDFAKAIIRLADASDMRLRMGSAARVLIKAEYNWERVAATFERVCQMLK
jgi:glycosyltransferase involved in cell wall biosynthesis